MVLLQLPYHTVSYNTLHIIPQHSTVGTPITTVQWNVNTMKGMNELMEVHYPVNIFIQK